MNVDTLSSRLTIEYMMDNKDEELLLRHTMLHFYNMYLPKLRDEFVLLMGSQSLQQQMARFHLQGYFVARCWLTSHKALAGCLELKRRYPPGWLEPR